MGWLAGVVILFLGLMASIALHELGHLSFAKLFKVRVPQYMVGFGPTIWSRRRGETEYGIKWIPLGGYIRMIGMLPPRKGDRPGEVRQLSTGPWQGLIESARGASLEEVRPGDEGRVFYAKKWWQKLTIMFAGPAMNLLLAVVFFAILIMGIGIPSAQPVVSSVAKCAIPSSQVAQECPTNYQPTPAAQVGLKPGDKFLTFGGQRIESYSQLQKLIRASGGKTVPAVVERDGQRLSLNIPLVHNQMYDLEDTDKVVSVGFLGITPIEAREQQGPGEVATQMAELTKHTVGALLRMPQKMVGIWQAAFSNEERDPNGPIGVVGVSRIGGEVLASENPVTEKVAIFVGLLASLNLAVGLFNLVPLLPLDGGHMAGALWEGLKKALARVFRRPDPGYVDVAKALPLTYAMAAILLVMGGLLVYADLVNPIHFNG